jgi:cytochrome o ubiquinol oxidase subunit III
MNDSQPNDILNQEKNLLGFWIYLMTDCVLFATLFASYAVLRHNTDGGHSAHELFSLPLALSQTLILLTSSLSCGLALLSAQHQPKIARNWLIVTGMLGALFLGLEINEFVGLVQEGAAWHRSAFLSSFFTLVGTHGGHIMVGLVWIGFLIWRLSNKDKSAQLQRQIKLFGLFWHFLDIIWIFIFSIVYLFGVAGI